MPLQKRRLDVCPSHFKPIVYRRSVDDIFILFSSKEHLHPFVDYMNNQHRCIKFASKTEQNNTFIISNINITRQNNQVKTSVYRKPTFSSVFTHNGGYIDQYYKNSLIFNFLSRCCTTCLDYTLFHLEVEKLRQIFKKNSYSSGAIERSIKTFLSKFFVIKQVYLTATKKELLIILPFLRTMSLNSKQKLQTSIRNSSLQCNIKVILKSTNHFSSLFRFKDVIPKDLRSHLVYKFLCSRCNATYFGKTARHLNVKSGKHISLSSLIGNRVSCKTSPISDHLLSHEQINSSFNNFSILRCENNTFKLSLRESILIKRDSPKLNRIFSSIPLLLFN